MGTPRSSLSSDNTQLHTYPEHKWGCGLAVRPTHVGSSTPRQSAEFMEWNTHQTSQSPEHMKEGSILSICVNIGKVLRGGVLSNDECGQVLKQSPGPIKSPRATLPIPADGKGPLAQPYLLPALPFVFPLKIFFFTFPFGKCTRCLHIGFLQLTEGICFLQRASLLFQNRVLQGSHSDLNVSSICLRFFLCPHYGQMPGNWEER